jgi:hypothetical protein
METEALTKEMEKKNRSVWWLFSLSERAQQTRCSDSFPFPFFSHFSFPD